MNDFKTLLEALKYYFGFDNFKGQQEDIVRNVLDKNDTFVLMPTGGGKSLCYQLPALLMDGTAIVISPLISLMKNQVDAIKHIGTEGNVAHFINSSLTKATIDEVKDDIRKGYTKLLYVAPESLAKKENIDFLKTIKISFFAIDEAHCISEWGHDFRPEYRKIRDVVDALGSCPIIALTATATDKVKTDIKKNLKITEAHEFRSSFNRQNLYYEVRPKTKNVDKDIIKFIKANSGKSGIIYCLSRKKVEELAEVLKVNGIKAEAYHAGMDSQVRNEAQDKFLMEEVDVIVATIAFGMGIDKPDVRFVIHYDIPKSLEGYYQETGRAGRDGGEGRCIAFYSEKDKQKLMKFMEGKPVAEQDIGRQLLEETVNYCESSVCRRKLLLHYFGEKYEVENCGNCDNCNHPKTQIEAKESLQVLLQVVEALKENFKKDYIEEVLLGKESDQVVLHKHNKIDFFGKGNDHEIPFWNAVINHAVLQEYLKCDIENYGTLKLTPKGRDFINNPKSFKIVENVEFDDNSLDEPQGGVSSMDETLYSMLTSLRLDMAKQLKVPPYVIFQDPSLDAMTLYYPQTIEELQNIPGVGVGKAKRYGPKFVDLIKRYCQENEIVRETDMRVLTTPDKSKMKKMSIIQSIDRKISLYDIAEMLGLEFIELIKIIESIIYSGTKLNISYFIEEEVDEDHEEEIYDYFMNSDTDDLDTALDNLDGDITEEEVRLVRIQFISELGN